MLYADGNAETNSRDNGNGAVEATTFDTGTVSAAPHPAHENAVTHPASGIVYRAGFGPVTV